MLLSAGLGLRARVAERPLFFWVFSLCVGGLFVDGSAAQDKSHSKNGAPPVKITGVFESAQAAELKVTGEQVKSWVLEKIVPHGSRVEAQQNVAWFKTESIDKQIRDAEIELQLAQMGLDDSIFKFEQFLETQALDRATAERARQRAQQDYDYYIKVDRDYQLKSANFNLKLSEYALENVQEELNQLEKMYRQDELTEESEEIVLKRSRRDVESAQFRLENSRNSHRRTVEETLPRNEAEQVERLKRAEMAHEAALKDLNLARLRRELELKKQQIKFDEQKEALEKLKAERANAVLVAPVAGIVVHGALNRGAQPERSGGLEPGKSLTADQVVATVIPGEPLQVRLTVNEADLRHVAVGMKVPVIANLYPQVKMAGTVDSVSSVPFSGSKFDCVVQFEAGELAGKLIPTTGCRVEFANLDPATTDSSSDGSGEAAAEGKPAGQQEAKQPPTTEEKAGGEQADSETMESTAKQSAADDPQRESAAVDLISGTWNGRVLALGEEVTTFEMVLVMAADDSVSGTLSVEGETLAIEAGRFHRDSAKLVFRVLTPVGPIEPEFALVDKTLTAIVASGQGVELTLSAEKQ